MNRDESKSYYREKATVWCGCRGRARLGCGFQFPAFCLRPDIRVVVSGRRCTGRSEEYGWPRSALWPRGGAVDDAEVRMGTYAAAGESGGGWRRGRKKEAGGSGGPIGRGNVRVVAFGGSVASDAQGKPRGREKRILGIEATGIISR